jgi:uncharacterized protein YjiS (DUF1127 family)
MSTTYGSTGLGQTAASTRRVSRFFKRYWGAFQERRTRQRLRATLCDLSDRELIDIGTTRGEIDYVASNRGIDPPRHPIGRSNERLKSGTGWTAGIGGKLFLAMLGWVWRSRPS